MAALLELRHLVGMALGTPRRAGLVEDVGSLVLDRPRVTCLHLVAVLARHLGCGHRTVAILLDDARGGVAVTRHASVIARRQRIDLARYRGCRAAPDREHDDRQP